MSENDEKFEDVSKTSEQVSKIIDKNSETFKVEIKHQEKKFDGK